MRWAPMDPGATLRRDVAVLDSRHDVLESDAHMDLQMMRDRRGALVLCQATQARWWDATRRVVHFLLLALQDCPAAPSTRSRRWGSGPRYRRAAAEHGDVDRPRRS